MSTSYETHIGDVNILWDTHWWCHDFTLSGPEVFTKIFLQFLPKTRLAKYDQSEYKKFKLIWLQQVG